MHRSVTTAFAAAAILLTCGCPESGEARRKVKLNAAWAKHKVALKAFSEQLPKLADDAAGQAKRTEASAELSEPLDCRSKTDGHNALVVQLEDLGDEGPTYLLNLGDKGTLRTAETVSTGEVPTSIGAMATAAGVRFVVVVRVHEVRGPVIPTGGISKFERGHVRGDALVYDMQDGACKGGFPFEGTNSESVKTGTENPEEWLQNDLFRRTRRAVHDGIESLNEGNQGPLSGDDRLR